MSGIGGTIDSDAIFFSSNPRMRFPQFVGHQTTIALHWNPINY